MIKVILADHQRIFRIGMASALAAEDDIRIVGQPHSVEQLLHGLENFRAHVLVLSSAFLGRLDEIKRSAADQQTAILLLEEPGNVIASQFSPEVSGVMQRSADESTALRCIRHLARGGKGPAVGPQPTGSVSPGLVWASHTAAFDPNRTENRCALGAGLQEPRDRVTTGQYRAGNQKFTAQDLR